MDAKTLTHAKRLSRFAVIAAVIFAALTLVITPARALAHGEGVLQIGNEALTGEGMVAVGESTPVLRGSDGLVVLADGTFDSSTSTTSKCYGNVSSQNRFVPVIRWTSNNAIGKFQTKPPSGLFEDIQNTIDSALNMASMIPALVGIPAQMRCMRFLFDSHTGISVGRGFKPRRAYICPLCAAQTGPDNRRTPFLCVHKVRELRACEHDRHVVAAEAEGVVDSGDVPTWEFARLAVGDVHRDAFIEILDVDGRWSQAVVEGENGED